MAIVAILAFTVFCGALLSQSLNLGKNYMSGQMGADIMVVPRGYALNLQNTLLKSESNTFYMKENLTERISSIPGVKYISPQLYIGSLNASCCTIPVQLIGFDPKTDFTIKSWMTNMDSSKLGFGEVVTGSRVNATVGSEIWMFGQSLKVAANLDDTGMGFDSPIFMTLDTAKHLIKMSGKTAVHPIGSENSQISALFIKLEKGSKASEVAKNLLNEYPQTDVVILEEMMKDIKNEVSNIKGLIYGIQGLFWIVSILVLAVIYSVTTNERKREFGLILALGATRKKLESLIVTETLIISGLGALDGVLAASFIMFEFRMLIAVSLGIPYIQPTIGLTVKLVIISLLISVLTAVIACLYSIREIGHLETNIIIREYE